MTRETTSRRISARTSWQRLVLRRLFAVEHDIIEHFQGVEKRLIHVKVLVRRETSDEDDARFLGRHLAIPFVQFAIRRIGHRVIRFAVIARVLLEDDRARLLARPTRLIGFMFILDDARVFHLGTGVIQLQTRLIKSDALSATRLLWTNTPKIWSGRSIVNTFMARYQCALRNPDDETCAEKTVLAMDDDSRQ